MAERSWPSFMHRCGSGAYLDVSSVGQVGPRARIKHLFGRSAHMSVLCQALAEADH